MSARPLRVTAILAALATAAALVFGTTPLQAQRSVTGVVIDSASGLPLTSAIVELRASKAATPASQLTGPTGAFQFGGVTDGAYELIVRRIGFAPQTLAITAGANAVRLRVALLARTFALPELVVSADRRCDRGTEGAARFADVWDRVGVVDDATRLTLSDGRLVATLLTYDGQQALEARDASPPRQRVVRGGGGWRTFVAPEPAVLARDGFTRDFGDSLVFYGLEVTTVRSTEFRDTHCFTRAGDTVVAGQRLARMRFVPSRARKGMVDVQGTLALAPADGALRAIDFTYTGLPEASQAVRPGGTILFAELPWGGWVVNEWELRMPLFERRTTQRVASKSFRAGGAITTEYRTEPVAVGLVRSGGYLLRADRGNVVFIGFDGVGRIEGTAFDSTVMQPMAGARVELGSADRGVTADAAGRFVFADVLPGQYDVRATHPRLGMHAALVTVAARDTARVAVTGTSAASLVALRCGGEESVAEPTLLEGTTRDQASGMPIPHLALRAAYTAPPGSGMRDRTVELTADDAGRFRLCGIPLGAAVQFSGGDRQRADWQQRLQVDRPYLFVDLRIPGAR